MCRMVATVVISVWSGLCMVAAQEAPREQPHYPPGFERPGRFLSKVPVGGPPSGSPSQPSPASGPARQPMTQILVEPVPVVPARDGARQHKRLALRLRSAAANDLANTLNNLLRAEGQAGPAARHVVIVPVAIGNSLLIGGPPDAVDEVRKLIEELDQPAVMVLMEAIIAEAPAGEVKPAQTKTLARVRLVAANNKPASLAFGRKEPMIKDIVVTQSGQINSVEYLPTGTLLGVTPRVRPDDTVVFEIDIIDSRLGSQQEGATISGSKDTVILRTPIESIHASSTLCLRDGEMAVLGGQPPQAEAGEQVLILVTPHVIHTFTNP